MHQQSARLALAAATLLILPAAVAAAGPAAGPPRREKIAVMKVEAPESSRATADLLRTLLEEGVSQAVGARLQVITKDSAAATMGGGEKLAQCLEGASCDAEIGGALGVDYFVAATALRSPRGLELAISVLRIGRESGLLAKENRTFSTEKEMLDGVSAQAQAVVTKALGASPGGPEAGMVRLPGGTFKMEERGETVTVAPFLMDVTEVTAGAYAACVKAGKCGAEGLGGDYATYDVAGKENHPVTYVDWNQATAFCVAVGRRLPAEEEWAWAARGAERGTTYPWGNEEPGSQLCWNGGSVQRWEKKLGTCAAGSFPGGDSPNGIKDLAGNVWEWTSSAHTASSRVYRGGSWYYGTSGFFAAWFRSGGTPVYRDASVGFRCAKTP